MTRLGAWLSSLPIAPVLADLRQALTGGHAILQAPTGSGKSTGVPLALLGEPWLGNQRILMLQPRRAAARLSAARMAELLEEPLGETIGYQVRFERRAGERTRIDVLTEGILTRRLQADPELPGVGLIIFDEFHERNLEAELALAFALDVVDNLRPDLRILPMSATLDAEPLSRLLGEAPIIRGRGFAHPVDCRYLEAEGTTARRTHRAPAFGEGENPQAAAALAAVVPQIRRALREEAGDILVFLPGVAEIHRCQQALAASGPEPQLPLQVLPLHGQLPTEAQDLVLRGCDARKDQSAGLRRVILATDIAETSLTIPGIGVVVDSGLTRKPRFDPSTGLSGLRIEPISQASAAQRAGRAGRLGPGSCYRCWTAEQHRRRPMQRPPEIQHADLASFALQIAAWGLADPTALRWLEPPPQAAWQQAVDLLRNLGALKDSGQLTALGQAMASLPLHPRLAAMLCGAAAEAQGLAADLSAVISEPDALISSEGPPPADLERRLRLLADWRNDPNARSVGAAWVDRRRLARIDRAAKQLRKLGRLRMKDRTAGADDAARTPAELLMLAYPDRIAQARGAPGRYRLAGGGGATLSSADTLAGSPFLVAAQLQRQAAPTAGGPSGGKVDHRIRTALAITEDELRAQRLIPIQTRESMHWDGAREAVAARRIESIGTLILSEQPLPIATPTLALPVLLEQVRKDFAKALTWSPRARQLQARVRVLRRHDGDQHWPDLDDAALRHSLEHWLAPWLEGKTRFAEVRALDLAALLSAQLDWPQQQALERAAPTHWTPPAGKPRPIDYCAPEGPELALPLQEVFGTTETPRILEGRLPLKLRLLSPARRPLQITTDLASFWRNAYPEVRKELRGRYPKHHWPEDPWTAEAVAGGLKRRR